MTAMRDAANLAGIRLQPSLRSPSEVRAMTIHAKFGFLAAGILAMSLLLVVPAAGAGDPIVGFVNGSNPIGNLSMAELRKIFLSDRSPWDNGKSVSPMGVASAVGEGT